MSNKMIIPRTREEVDALNFKDVPMRIGAYKKTFVKNVVAIGLSGGFIEPLESNGLLTVHEWVINLLKLMQRPAINQYDIASYNHIIYNNWRGFADFVAMHYSMSIRTDTEYWRNNFKRDLIELYENNPQVNSKYNLYHDLAEIKLMTGKIHQVNSGMNWIMTGMHWFPTDRITHQHRFVFNEWWKGNSVDRKKYESRFKLLEQRKEKWRNNALKAQTLYDYQKKHIYNEE
jgi:tryptophan halogenase